VRIATSATFASALALATTPRPIIPTSLTVAHTADTSNAALARHPPTIACDTTAEAPSIASAACDTTAGGPAIASAACDTTTKAPAIASAAYDTITKACAIVSTTVFVYCTSHSAIAN
jgi:hypothetical protein